MRHRRVLVTLLATALAVVTAGTSAGAAGVGVGLGADANLPGINLALALDAQASLGAGITPAPSTVAVIGDIPYGAAKLAQFPANIAQINADPDVSLVAHLGDIKNGSSLCTDDYFATIKSDFDTFQDPLVYTPGDNEWTDCHRANNGGYNPAERLAKVRQVFFPAPGRTMGVNSRHVLTQALLPGKRTYVENTMFGQSGAIFSAINIPGSNNDLVPWFGVTPLSQTQLDEYNNRLKADLEWIDQTFLAARLTGAKGVALMLQADMWDTAALVPGGDGLGGFLPIVQRIARLSEEFGKPVLLLEGDSHSYRVDHPFTNTDPLYSIHQLQPAGLQAPNVTRVVVDGSGNAHDYLKLKIDPSSPAVFSWTQVNFN